LVDQEIQTYLSQPAEYPLPSTNEKYSCQAIYEKLFGVDGKNGLTLQQKLAQKDVDYLTDLAKFGLDINKIQYAYQSFYKMRFNHQNDELADQQNEVISHLKELRNELQLAFDKLKNINRAFYAWQSVYANAHCIASLKELGGPWTTPYNG